MNFQQMHQKITQQKNLLPNLLEKDSGRQEQKQEQKEERSKSGFWIENPMKKDKPYVDSAVGVTTPPFDVKKYDRYNSKKIKELAKSNLQKTEEILNALRPVVSDEVRKIEMALNIIQKDAPELESPHNTIIEDPLLPIENKEVHKIVAEISKPEGRKTIIQRGMDYIKQNPQKSIALVFGAMLVASAYVGIGGGKRSTRKQRRKKQQHLCN